MAGHEALAPSSGGRAARLGGAGNLGSGPPLFPRARDRPHGLHNRRETHHLLGIGVFIFDYRGYGRSDGSPTEAGLYLDARAAREALVQRLGIPPERVASLGPA